MSTTSRVVSIHGSICQKHRLTISLAPAATTAAPAPQQPAAYAPQSAAGEAYTDIPTSNMRRVIATRLSESKQLVPHYYVTVEVNMDKVNKLREVLNKSADGKYKLSVNDFIVKASALSLKKVPEVNSAWQGDFIRQYVAIGWRSFNSEVLRILW